MTIATAVTYDHGTRVDTLTGSPDEVQSYLDSLPGAELTTRLGDEVRFAAGRLTVYVTGLDI